MDTAANPLLMMNLPADGFKWWNRVPCLPEKVVEDIIDATPTANISLTNVIVADGRRTRRIILSTIPGAQ